MVPGAGASISRQTFKINDEITIAPQTVYEIISELKSKVMSLVSSEMRHSLRKINIKY